MQILMHEIGLCDTVDPLAGSWFIETMTNRMEQRIVAIMDELEKQGGIVRAVAEGRVQAAVNAQAYEMEKKIQTGEVKKVGVNIFAEEEEEEEREVEFHPYRGEEAKKQIDRLERIRRERDDLATQRTLERVRQAAQDGENVVPAVMDAVEAYASVGEVCGVLKEVFGTYREPVRF
jgi:methylmalonyl-CoA mutase N-terminal domain/subunit